MQAVVLAGGRSRRMGEIGRRRSKVLLPVAGLPLLGRVIASLAAGGVDGFLVVVPPEDPALQGYLSESGTSAYRLRAILQPTPLGMADGLRHAAEFLQGPFILSAGDSLVPSGEVARLREAWRGREAGEAILAVQPAEAQQFEHSAAVLVESGQVKEILEKPGEEFGPGLASLPHYGLPLEILPLLEDLPISPRGEFEIQTAIQRFIDQGGVVRVAEIRRRWQVTRPDDLVEINRHFLEADLLSRDPGLEAGIEAGQIRPPVHLALPYILEEGCQVGPWVEAEPGCRIGAGAKVTEAVLLEGAVIPPGAIVHRQVVG